MARVLNLIYHAVLRENGEYCDPGLYTDLGLCHCLKLDDGTLMVRYCSTDLLTTKGDLLFHVAGHTEVL